MRKEVGDVLGWWGVGLSFERSVMEELDGVMVEMEVNLFAMVQKVRAHNTVTVGSVLRILFCGL